MNRGPDGPRVGNGGVDTVVYGWDGPRPGRGRGTVSGTEVDDALSGTQGSDATLGSGGDDFLLDGDNDLFKAARATM